MDVSGYRDSQTGKDEYGQNAGMPENDPRNPPVGAVEVEGRHLGDIVEDLESDAVPGGRTVALRSQLTLEMPAREIETHVIDVLIQGLESEGRHDPTALCERGRMQRE